MSFFIIKRKAKDQSISQPTTPYQIKHITVGKAEILKMIRLTTIFFLFFSFILLTWGLPRIQFRSIKRKTVLIHHAKSNKSVKHRESTIKLQQVLPTNLSSTNFKTELSTSMCIHLTVLQEKLYFPKFPRISCLPIIFCTSSKERWKINQTWQSRGDYR